MIGTRSGAGEVLRALRAGEAPQPDAVDALAVEGGVPVVEGTTCTFLYRGEAERVALRHWIFGLPATVPFRRLPEGDVWVLSLELPPGSRVEYKVEVTREGCTELIRDPLNPHLARDPFGANSVCHAAGYEVPEWTRPDPTARSGAFEERRVRSRWLRGEREVTLYLPARFRRTRRYPLLVVHDGPDYLSYSGLGTVLDNLIHRLVIPGMVVALTRPEDRLAEYAASPAHARFLTRELVPALEKELPLLGTAEGRGLMGASLGAVAALHAAAQAPGFYGRLLLQSGSFAFSDIGGHGRGAAFDPVAEFVNRFRARPAAVSRKAFVSCGVYESLIYENRSLVPWLQRTGMEVRFVEARDGHNWENWRDRLREGLSWLFPGPLWMVYE